MNQIMSVQVKKSQVRIKPNYFASILVNVFYGDQVTLVEKKESWLKVKTAGRSIRGWMHESALTEQNIILKPGAEDVQKAASSDEYALAGKGFNQDVENEFKRKNRNLSFAWVDKMETFNVSQRQMQQFLKRGEVSAKGGAA